MSSVSKRFSREIDFSLCSSDLILGEKLASGNFASVYEGTYHGETVAIKEMVSGEAEADKYLKKELSVLG